GHVVPINGQAGAADIRAGRETDTVTEAQLAEFFLPLRSLGYALGAFPQPGGADPQAVYRHRVGFHQLFKTQIDRIDAQLFGDFIVLTLKSEARLGCAMPPLRSESRFIGEDAHTF